MNLTTIKLTKDVKCEVTGGIIFPGRTGRVPFMVLKTRLPEPLASIWVRMFDDIGNLLPLIPQILAQMGHEVDRNGDSPIVKMHEFLQSLSDTDSKSITLPSDSIVYTCTLAPVDATCPLGV